MPSLHTTRRIQGHLVHYVGRVCIVAKNSFIPHEGNDDHPHVLRHTALVGYSVLMILLKTLAVVLPIALPSSSLYSSAITTANIVSLTNQVRENLELPPLVQNALLTKAAQAKALDMLQNQYFAHTSPSGKKAWDFIRSTGYKYLYSGENLAVHYSSAEDVQGAWVTSPSHRANMVNSHFTEIGVGIQSGSFEGTSTLFVVQMFGAPKTDEQEEQIATLPKAQPSKTLVIDESTVKVVPQKKSVAVAVQIANATSVVAHLSSNTVPLTQTAKTGEWGADIAIDPNQFGSGGETLTVTAVDERGHTTTSQLATVAPNTTPQKLFIFQEGSGRFTRLFGVFAIRDLDDKVRQTYVFLIVFLSAALLLNMFIRMKNQHVSVLAHTLAVIALATILTVL